MTTLQTRELNFAGPVAPHRGRIYLGVGLLTGVVFLGMTIGVEFDLVVPTFASDVIANLLFGIPVLLVPLVILWDAPGEQRSSRLIKVDLSDESRIRCLWGAFAGCTVLMSSTAVYFVAAVGAGFDDIGQGAFSLWFKFIGENTSFIVLPPLVLYSIHLQIDYLTRRVGKLTAA